MKYLVSIVLFFTVFQSCNQTVKYEITNSIPEKIDITKYIESGEFIIQNCEGRLDKIIKVKPKILDKSYENLLQKKLKSFDINYLNFKVNNLHQSTIYQYSYFITSEPIDVYKTELKINSKIKKIIYIRLNQKGELISDFSEFNWVENNCD